MVAVIVGGDHPAAEVAVGAHVTVADIGQVRNRSFIADRRIFDLHKVAQLDPVAEVGVGAELGERPDRAASPDRRIGEVGSIDVGAFPDL